MKNTQQSKISMIMRSKIIVSIMLFSISISAKASAQLIFAIDVIRHGDRTPVKEIPVDNHIWPLGLGELTPTGMAQEFRLGQSLRKLYIDKYHLLAESYTSGSIYVRSSDYNRTLMSAEAVLMGLYPLGSGARLPHSESPALPMFFQPIPIHTVAREQDSLLISKQNGQAFESAIANYVFSSQIWQDQFNRQQKNLSRWAQASGMPLSQLQQVISLGNTLFIRRLYGIPLPSGVSQNDADQIISLGRWAVTTIYQAYPVGYAASWQLINTILNYLTTATAAKRPKLKYVLFSAHDSTILGLMSGLKVPLHEPPPYASDLKIMLFNDNNRYLVQLMYNGAKVTIPGCKTQPCSLDEFNKLYKTN